MNQRIVVAGTDTEIGKTVFSAGLAALLGANYWKPIQAGLEGETDSQLVARLGGLSDDRIVPERYRLKTPASPHHAAAVDGVRIAVDSLDVPDTGGRPLVIVNPIPAARRSATAAFAPGVTTLSGVTRAPSTSESIREIFVELR